jgi:tyrosinase
LRRLAPNGKYNEWITNIRVKKHCLGGAFQVHVFFDGVPPDPLSWLTHRSNVGTFFVLGSDLADSGCDKCKRDEEDGLKVRGIVPLTSSLVDVITQGKLSSLDPANVVPYLIDNIYWRVTLVRASLSITI